MRKAIFPVAGYGTRMMPATKAIPKEMLPIVDRPAIHYTAEEAAKSGFDWIVLVTARGKEPIINYFDRDPELEAILRAKGMVDMAELLKTLSEAVRVFSVRQGIPMGLGHAVLCAREIVGDEPFAVVLPDDIIMAEKPVLAQMLDVFLQTGKSVVALEEVERERVSSYGIIKGKPLDDAIYEIERLIEKPAVEEAPSNLAVIGRYILSPEVFTILEKIPPGRGGEIQLTDALSIMASRGMLVGYKFKGDRFDIGNPEGFLKANIAFGKARGLEI